jgi:hypothetical protein
MRPVSHVCSATVQDVCPSDCRGVEPLVRTVQRRAHDPKGRVRRGGTAALDLPFCEDRGNRCRHYHSRFRHLHQLGDSLGENTVVALWVTVFVGEYNNA